MGSVGAQHRQVCERWPAACPAYFQGGGGKPRVTLLQKLAQQRVVRQAGLQHQQPRLLAPTCPTRYLHQRLRHPLGSAELLGEQALVGVDHANQPQAGKVMPLGEHLGAEQDAVVPFADAAQDVLQSSPAAHVVAIHARQRHAGEAHGKLLLQPFGSAANRVEARPALFATQRRPAAGAAMMTKEPVAFAVEDHARIAMSAFLRFATVRTHEHGSETAAIEVQQYLRAGVQLLGHRPDQGLAQPVLRRVPIEVDQPRQWRSGAGYLLGQAMPEITPFLNIQQRLQRRRRGSENHGNPLFRSPHHGQVPGLVAETVLLLIGGIVLLVDHDQAEFRARRKHCRAGAHHKPGTARTRISPGPQALALVQPRVQHRRRRTEACSQPAGELRRKTDFRRQQQALLAGGEDLFHQVQVDLGLAAGGYPVQKMTCKAPALSHRLHRDRLFRAQGKRFFPQRFAGLRGRRFKCLGQPFLPQGGEYLPPAVGR